MALAPDRTVWLRGGSACCDRPTPKLSRPYRLVLLGPPGVGKGTQAEGLCYALGACHLSTGDVFRAARSIKPTDQSPALRDALAAMRRGELASDEVVVDLVRERAGCLRCPGGFLLDGYPRSLAQAEALDALLAEMGIPLDGVICYRLPLEEIIARLSGRRTCPACGTVFHLVSCPPRVSGVCDRCGASLVQRDDDAPDAIRVRLQVYEAATLPLIDHYARQNRLIGVDADSDPETVLARSLETLSAHY